jgi:hypothetical protein
MNPIILDLPCAQVVFANLYDTLSPDWLDEDLVFVRLLDGSKVEVGWYGESGAGGYFKIVRYNSSWNSPLDVVRTGDVGEVVKTLKRFNEQAIQPRVQPLSNAVMQHYTVDWPSALNYLCNAKVA